MPRVLFYAAAKQKELVVLPYKMRRKWSKKLRQSRAEKRPVSRGTINRLKKRLGVKRNRSAEPWKSRKFEPDDKVMAKLHGRDRELYMRRCYMPEKRISYIKSNVWIVETENVKRSPFKKKRTESISEIFHSQDRHYSKHSRLWKRISRNLKRSMTQSGAYAIQK